MLRFVFAVAVGLAAGCATPLYAQSGPNDLVKQAVAAAGGEPALRALKTLRVHGNARFWEPDQSLVPNGPALQTGDSKFTMTWDFPGGATRTDWDRTFIGRPPQKYSEVVSPKLGFVIDDKGAHAMSGIRHAAQLRELLRLTPLLLLKMLDAPGDVAFEGGLKLSAAVLPAVTFKDGNTTFHVLFNKITKLPAAVRSYDEDSMRGSAVYDVVYENWRPMPGGAMLPYFVTYTLADNAICRVTVTEVTPNPQIDSEAFAVGADVKAAFKPATGTVPYQWVIRRLNIGRFLDSDDIFVPHGGGLKFTELAPNVQHITGGSHNSLVVAMKDGAVVFEAPTGDGQARWTIDAVRAKLGKPVKTLVLTHHHSDHTAGVRTYMAERVPVLVPVPDRKYFTLMALTQRPVPDDLEKKKISPDVSEIKDEMEIKDDGVSIHLYRIANPHADGMLIAHIMPANIVWVTDLWSPGEDTVKTPGANALHEALKKHGITGATIAGGHGGTAPQAELEKIFASN
jgi:glyoxylase-like metal-dependent hydrolase (beta-lactamase superfamily II)